MNWFWIALGAPFLWAIVNIADNYLVSNFTQREKEKSSGGLVLFSSLIGILISFIILLLFFNDIFNVPLFDKFLLIITGGLTIVWIIFYLYALEIEEISSIVPWFLVVPVFGYILGFIFLGETLTNFQIIGSIIVLFGALLISIDFNNGNKKIKRKPVLYMIFACLSIAVSGIIFKFVTIEGNFWSSSFWEYFGLGFFGIIIYLLIPKYRREFHFMNRSGGRKIFLINIVSELMSVSGNLLTNFALILAPVTMVYLVSTFQPAIVLVLTILGTKFVPHIIKEDISKKVLIKKIVAIIIMILGSIFLFV